MKLLTDDSAVEDEHPVDRHYRQLACDIQPLDDDHPTVQLVRDYVKNTHGRTHHFGLEVEQVDPHTQGAAKHSRQPQPLCRRSSCSAPVSHLLCLSPPTVPPRVASGVRDRPAGRRRALQGALER